MLNLQHAKLGGTGLAAEEHVPNIVLMVFVIQWAEYAQMAAYLGGREYCVLNVVIL